MINVKVYDKEPYEIMEIVRELRQLGLAQGTDFDFNYNKPIFDQNTYQLVTKRCTVFTFYKEELASWFILKYQ